jgi:hypothetical protein
MFLHHALLSRRLPAPRGLARVRSTFHQSAAAKFGEHVAGVASGEAFDDDRSITVADRQRR